MNGYSSPVLLVSLAVALWMALAGTSTRPGLPPVAESGATGSGTLPVLDARQPVTVQTATFALG